MGTCSHSTLVNSAMRVEPPIRSSWLETFLSTHREDNFLSVKHGNYLVQQEEAVGEIVDWTLQYLHYM